MVGDIAEDVVDGLGDVWWRGGIADGSARGYAGGGEGLLVVEAGDHVPYGAALAAVKAFVEFGREFGASWREFAGRRAAEGGGGVYGGGG